MPPLIWCAPADAAVIDWMLRDHSAEVKWRGEMHRKWWARLTPAQRIREQRFMDQKRKLEWQLARKPVVTPGDPGWQIRYHNPTADVDENGEFL